MKLVEDGRVDRDGEELLTGEVEREVLVGLEEAELADLFGGDAAGGEVGDAAGFELDANVGDVGLAREDGQTDGTDLAYGGFGEREDDVEVVDHEVEDDVDVERARGEDAEAVGLEEHGLVEGREGRGDGRVEAFQMADGDDAAVVSRQGDDVVGFGEGGGEGLFDEDVDAGGEQISGDAGVVDGGHADGCGVDGCTVDRCIRGHPTHVAMRPRHEWATRHRRQEFGDAGEGGDVILRGERVAARGVGLDEGGEVDEVRVGGLELTVDAQMVAAEGTGADDGDAKGRHGYFFGVGDSTASRQRA